MRWRRDRRLGRQPHVGLWASYSVTGRALIIGGTGFVGRHLKERLSDRYDVTASGQEEDIRKIENVRSLVALARPDIVVNLAAITTVKETFENPVKTYEIGFFGLLNLFTVLKEQGYPGRVLQVSSSEVYGFPTPDQLPLTEEAPFRPMSPYSVAKAAGEILCHQWSQMGYFEILLARPFTHIGPGQSGRFSIANFAKQITEIATGHREPSLEAGNLDATRDLTDVRDIVRAYDLILHHGKNRGVYNVCSGREISLRDVLNELVHLSGRDVTVVQDETRMRESEQQRLCGSNKVLNRDTGWVPEIPLTRTLSDILAFELSKAGKTPTNQIAATQKHPHEYRDQRT